MSSLLDAEGMTAVVTILGNASSQRPHLIKAAEQQLQQWEKQPGFYLALLQVYMNKSLELNVRWMATICFKNGIDKYWRAIGEQKLVDSEMAAIRSGLVSLCYESENMSKLALQLAVCTGKVARQDCPNNWPELLPALLQIVSNTGAVSSHDLMVRQRALLTLHHVVKQIASKRLIPDRRKFQDLAAKLFPEIYHLYKTELEGFVNLNQTTSCLVTIAASLQRAHSCLKILRKLSIYGFKMPESDPVVSQFHVNMCQQIKFCLMIRKQHEADDFRVPTEKFTSLLMKCLLELLQIHPYSFLKYAREVLQMVTTLTFTDEGCGVMYERFTLQCFVLLKSFFDCNEYNFTSAVDLEQTSDVVKEAHQIKAEIFTKSVLEQICHRIITKYLILSRDELEMWESDSESFCSEIDLDDWKFVLRGAIEAVFKTLYNMHKDAFTPVLLTLMKEVMQMTDSSNFQGILSKDAVYSAFGLISYSCIDEVNFDSWFTEHLVHELQRSDSNYRILRRRVIWLIGQWTNVRFSSKNRVLLYQACIHLLTHDTDFVVRYYTATTLRSAIDDYEFDCKDFMPYLPTIFALLFNLMKEAKECDVKMRILYIMSMMIEVVGSEVRESAKPLVQFLPQLWEESQQFNMLRCAILVTLIRLVKGMGSDSLSLQSFLVEVLHVSTDINHDCHVYLSEDGLTLWLSVLENTPSDGQHQNVMCSNNELPVAYSNLLMLYANILPMMDSSTLNLKDACKITIAYIVLCPRYFLQKYGRELLDILGGQINDLKDEAQQEIMKLLDVIIRTCGADGVQLVRPVLAILASTLIKEAESQYPQLVTAHLTLLSRVLLCDYESFLWIIEQVAKRCDDSSQSILTEILRIWCHRMRLISPEDKMKLAALGLCRLVAVNLPSVVTVWTRAVETVVEVVYDVTNEEDNTDKFVKTDSDFESKTTTTDSAASSSQCISGNYEEDEDSKCYGGDYFMELDTEHGKRMHALERTDPVYSVSLRKCLGDALLEFQRVSPPEMLAQLMKNMIDDAKNVVQDVTAQVSSS